MQLPSIYTVTTADQARQLVIDWQTWASNTSTSWGDMADWSDFFRQLATKYDLTDEFVENGIL